MSHRISGALLHIGPSSVVLPHIAHGILRRRYWGRPQGPAESLSGGELVKRNDLEGGADVRREGGELVGLEGVGGVECRVAGEAGEVGLEGEDVDLGGEGEGQGGWEVDE